MRIVKFIFLIFITGVITVSCATTSNNANNNGNNINNPVDSDPVFDIDNIGDKNFRFVASDININNPENDKRSYYRIFIDKIDAGRTTIGLESQSKTIEKNLSVDRHVISIEKFVLDEKQGKYVKLNNIFQPKPSFFYFDMKPEMVVVIKMQQTQKDGKANYILKVFDK